MVKTDVRRDCYADLGLGHNAETEDIKTQFRKLALKYHPDRNRGREHEFNAKFQAIQAANEILSNPRQRLKYDTDRLRAGYGKAHGYHETAQNKRQPHPFASAARWSGTHNHKSSFNTRSQTPSDGPSAGAQKYRSRPEQTPGTTDSDSDARDWRSSEPEAGHATPPPEGTPRQQNAPFGNSRPRPANKRSNDDMKSQERTGPNLSRKKYRFDPGTATGDEPMAPSTYTSSGDKRPSSMYLGSTPAPNTEEQADPEPPLFSTRYARTGGEKIFFARPGSSCSPMKRTPWPYRPDVPSSAEKGRTTSNTNSQAYTTDGYASGPSGSSSVPGFSPFVSMPEGHPQQPQLQPQQADTSLAPKFSADKWVRNLRGI